MPDDGPLASPADLATYLAREVGPNAEMMLTAASAVVRSYCGWHIAPERADDVVVLDGKGALVVALPSLHVASVSQVINDGQTVTDYDWSAAGMLYRRAGWSLRFGGIRVTYTHGHKTTPPDVMAVVAAMAARAIASPAGVVREQTGPFSVTYTQTAPNQAGGVGLLNTERFILDRYRIAGQP